MKFSRALVFLVLAVALRAEPEYPKQGPDIYDTKIDGGAQVEEALSQARLTHRRVLLDLGANWCIWCRRLHQVFESDPLVKPLLEANFVLVMIDVNQRDGKNRNAGLVRFYDNPVEEGLPVLLVLDADGKKLVTQETGALEAGKDGHDPKKVADFLTKWAPKRQP